MFAFEIWGKFASFKDPFTISQNISFSIPPKTTLAGMLAGILGLEEYIKDKEFFDFKYSVVVINPIVKKSFSQNYINDYTAKSLTQLNNLQKKDIEKLSTGLRDKKSPQKPINRELLLNPKYLIFVENFKYETKIKEYLQNRISKFAFYLGNSEFAGNFKYIDITNIQTLTLQNNYVDSFVLNEDSSVIEFESLVRYSNITFALNLKENRVPYNFQSVIVSNKEIKVKNLEVTKISTKDKDFYCRFV